MTPLIGDMNIKLHPELHLVLHLKLHLKPLILLVAIAKVSTFGLHMQIQHSQNLIQYSQDLDILCPFALTQLITP